MFRKKVLFLAVIMSVGLTFGFVNQSAFASEAETDVIEENDEISMEPQVTITSGFFCII